MVCLCTYDAWGNHTVADYTEFNLGNINPIRYRSYYFDTETGLYFLQSRYYDPQTGRFISMDDISYLDPETIGGANLYAYCGNNPIMRVDPTGHDWDWGVFWRSFASGLLIVGGAVLCFVPGLQLAGVGLILTGTGGILGGIIGELSGVGFDYGGSIGTIAGGVIGLTVMTAGMLGPSIGAFLNTTYVVGTVGGTVTLSATGAQILGVAGALIGSIIVFSKGSGPRMGHNQYENKQFNSLCNKHKLTKEQRRILHDYISGQNYSYHEIEQIIIELFFS